MEAKAAKIPVILTDRAVDVKDDSLYVTFMGSDFVEEGRKAGRWLVEKEKDNKGPVNIVELQGTVGSAPAIDRKKGFEEIIKSRSEVQDHPLADRRLHPRQGQGSDGSLPEGRGQEDQRALRAQRRHGDRRDPGHRGSRPEAGQDIIIISVDGVKGAFEAMMAGKLNVTVECSPLLGPAADERGGRHQGRQAAAQAHPDQGRASSRWKCAKAEFPNRKY